MDSAGGIASLQLDDRPEGDGLYTVASMRLMTPAEPFEEFDAWGFSVDLMNEDVPLDAGRDVPMDEVDLEDVISMRGHRIQTRPWKRGVTAVTATVRTSAIVVDLVSDMTVFSVLLSILMYALEGALYNAVFTELDALDLLPSYNFGDSLSISILSIVFAFIVRAIVNKALTSTTETVPHLYQFYRECKHMVDEAVRVLEDSPERRVEVIDAIQSVRVCVVHGLAMAAALTSDRADTGAPTSKLEQEVICRGMEGHRRMTTHVETLVKYAVSAFRNLGVSAAADRLDSHVRVAIDGALFQHSHLARRAIMRLVSWFLIFYGHIIVPCTLWFDIGAYMIVALPVTLVMYDLLSREMAITSNTFNWEKKSPHDTRFSAWEQKALRKVDKALLMVKKDL